MKKYKYIIIGGGMTGGSAVKGIRETDPDGNIALFSNEHANPYNRPPLTKDLWKGKEFEKIFLGIEKTGSDIYLNTNVISIQTDSKTIEDDKGNKYEYDKLLLATGGQPLKLPFGDKNILYYRKLGDYEILRDLVERKNDFTVIGGGFIGSEIAAALSMNGKSVTMIFPEEFIGEKIYPPDIADFITNFFNEKGVKILNKDSVLSLETRIGEHKIKTKNGIEISTDYVIGGIGIKPDTQLAESVGIYVPNSKEGIHVNEFLMTNIEDIYAAGDVANFYNPILEKRIRIEHADNANKMGKAAGLSMAGKGEPYHYLPFFYSDLFELGYEAIGELYSSFQTYIEWETPYKKGVIYYLNEDKHVRGVLLWDVWGKVNDARNLIARKEKIKNPEDLKGRISFK